MKYMGSKARIAPFISEKINNIALCEGIKDYYEPFMGGCSVGEQVLIENKYMSDSNITIVELFKKAQTDMFDFNYISKEEWYKIKADRFTFNTYEPWQVGWAGLACSFRGRPFSAYAGIYTDKANGKERNPQLEAYNALISEIPLISSMKFTCCDYKDIGRPLHSIIYCDAPYRGTAQYQMVDKFNFDEYDAWLLKMAKDNLVLISEYSMIGRLSSSFELLETWNLQSSIGSGHSDDVSNMECLYYVKNGWLTDKYFGESIDF